jgi:hypothetical protein
MNCKIIFGDDVITMQKTSYADIFKTACDTLIVDSFIRERVLDLIRNNKIQEALTCLKENVETSDFDIIIE